MRAAASLLAIALLSIAGRGRAAELELRVLDVGQGSACLIRHQGKAVLVDTGPSDGILDQLARLGVAELDALVVSHNHADHLGGADAVLAALPVRHYLDNGFPAKTKLQESVLALVEARGVTYLEATVRTLALGDALLRLLPPQEGVGDDNQNDRSLGVLLERGRFRALLPGDAEVQLLGAWLDQTLVPDLDLLVAAHHGSRNGVTPRLLQIGRPEVVVVSCGAANDYGHPHLQALRYYHAGGRRVLRTDQDGEVVVWVAADGAYRVELAAAATAPPQRQPAAPAISPPGRFPAIPEPPSQRCCRICRQGRACGDGCVARDHTCNQPKGCACDGS